jgi:hypothetical protein
MVVYYVFVLMSVSSFQDVEDNLEKPYEPLVDFARFIQRIAVHGELSMLRVLVYIIRNYIRPIIKTKYWSEKVLLIFEILESFVSYSITESVFVGIVSRID